MCAILAACVLLNGCARGYAPSGRGEGPASGRPVRASGQVGCSAADLARPARETLTGLATYYADSLAGNRTASGDRYDPARLTAAHRSLPFGTRLRVMRTDTETPLLCVRVNDRGPYAGRRRIIDLSRRAAEGLRMVGKGVVPVRVEVL